MMAKGVLEIVSDPGPGFYSRLFLIEKSSGGWRPIIDLSPLNEFIHQTPFRMETPNSVLLVVRKNDFLASIHLKDAYFQIPVHPSSRKLLRFVSNDTVYQFRALCFGLSTAPQVFTKVFAAVSSWAHSRGPPATIPGRLADLVLLGNQDKTSRQSTPHTLLLPRHSDEHGEIRPLPVQVRRIPQHDHRHGISPSIPHRDSNTEIPLLSKEVPIPTEPPGPVVAGVVRTHVIVGEARLWMRSLQWHLKSNRSTENNPPHLPVPRSRQVDRDISWWMVRDHLLKGMPFAAPPPPPPRALPILGCVSVGVGSPPPRSISVGTMVRPGDLTPHQYLGDESPVPGTSDLPGQDHQPVSDSNVRQLHSCSLRQQAGRDSF